jgi:DDE superfamily endonuclease/Helix-turn-helix of DDE superfamily endonuclease
MMFRMSYLSRHLPVFRAMTGLTPAEFGAYLRAARPAVAAAQHRRRDRHDRRRDVGAGHPYGLTDPDDRILCTVVWLRLYPSLAVLGYFFGISESAARRTVAHTLPGLEQAGLDTMRLPTADRPTNGKSLPRILRETPEVAVVIDSLEQAVQRPRRRQKRYYSGKKKRHTQKVQVAVDEETGKVCHATEAVPGPTADLELLRQSKLLSRLARGVGALGDAAYRGMDRILKRVRTAVPRRKPRGQQRPPEDRRFNRAFSRRRIVVEHGIGKLRRYQAVTAVDRHRRRGAGARVRAIAGLVNLAIDLRRPA